MPDRDLSDLRCFVCGRVGVRGFRHVPQMVHEPSGQKVGPFDVCANKAACYRRQHEQHRRAGSYVDA